MASSVTFMFKISYFIECTGRVFIGELDANKTVRTQERYVFNVNYDVSALYIPVAVQLFNTTSQVPCNSYTSNVSIIIKNPNKTTIKSGTAALFTGVQCCVHLYYKYYNTPKSLSVFANCRSQFLLDRLGRCLKLPRARFY